MSIARLSDSISRAAEGIEEPLFILLADLAKDHDAPPPSTIRRIIRDWPEEGVELAGLRVRAEKKSGRLYLAILPRGRTFVVAKPAPRTIPLYHQFGRVVSA
jgi:hypothetical protein